MNGPLSWKRLAPSVAGIFFIVLAYMSFYVLPKHLEDIGATRDEVGRIMSMWGWPALFLVPFIGHWMDVIGRKPFVMAGTLLMAVSAFGFAGVTGIGWPVYALRAALGTGFIVSYAAAVSMQVDLSPPRDLPFVFLITGVWALTTHLAGPVVAEWLHAEFGFRVVGYSAAAVSLAAAANFLVIPDTHVRHETEGEKAPPAADIFRFMSERKILPVLLLNLIEVASYTAVATFIIVYCRSKGMASGRGFFIAYPLMAIALRLAAGRAQERFGQHALIYGTMVFYVLSIGLVPLIEAPWQLFLMGLGFGVGVTYVNPLLNALAIERARNPAYSGRITSWFIWAWCLGGTMSPVVFGHIAQKWGYSTMFVSVAGMLLTGNLVFWRNERRIPEAPLQAGDPEPVNL